MPDFAAPMVRPVSKEAEVAIIGSGPAGLSCGYFLALMDRSSVIFEAQPIPGGMLALGIPEFRLPKKMLRKEIDFILSHGVELHTDSRIEDIRELMGQSHKAVFVATGAQRAKSINIKGNDLKGVIDPLEFLRERALGRGLDCAGKRIIVLGGGNVAMDAASSAVRLGAKKVTILYRRTREEMPAYQNDIDEAIKEGVEIITLALPKQIVEARGSVEGVEFVGAEQGKTQSDGRRRPVPIEGSSTVLECDMVIPAIGQIPSTEIVDYADGPKLTDSGAIQVDVVSLETTVERLFAGGDCVTGPSSVINAIAAGQRAAVNIDKHLGGGGELPHDTGFSILKPPEESATQLLPRSERKTISLKKRRRGFAEVVLGLDKAQALAEASRCLRCDLEK